MAEDAVGVGCSRGEAEGPGVGFGRWDRAYRAEQVSLIRCSHVREMRGETEEVVRRTRDEAAENAVLEAVRKGGAEPDWFVERWLGEADGGFGLVACAVFEDAGRVAPFEAAVAEKGGEAAKVWRGEAAAEALREKVAEYFTAEWSRRRAEQVGRLEAVVADARERGSYRGRVVVGEYAPKDADGKAAFARLCEALNESFPKDADGFGGIAYSGFWDGDVARFAFGFASVWDMMSAQERMETLGARFYDPLSDGCEGVELEMAAYVIAKMQGDEAARKAKDELERGVAEAAREGVEKAVAAEAEKAMA